MKTPPWAKIASDYSGLGGGMSLAERAAAIEPQIHDALMIKELTPPGAVIVYPYNVALPFTAAAAAYPRRFYWAGNLEAQVSRYAGDDHLKFLGSARENAIKLYGQSVPFDHLYIFLSEDFRAFRSLGIDDIVVKTEKIKDRRVLRDQGVLLTLVPGLSLERVESILAAIEQPKEILLAYFEDTQHLNNWTPYWMNNVEGGFRMSNGVLVMDYENNLSQRDIFAHTFVPHQSISMVAIRLRAYVMPGTRLTIDTVVNGELVSPRFLENYPGTGEWEWITIPVGGELDALTISIAEQSAERYTEHYELQIGWIRAMVVDTDKDK